VTPAEPPRSHSVRPRIGRRSRETGSPQKFALGDALYVARPVGIDSSSCRLTGQASAMEPTSTAPFSGTCGKAEMPALPAQVGRFPVRTLAPRGRIASEGCRQRLVSDPGLQKRQGDLQFGVAHDSKASVRVASVAADAPIERRDWRRTIRPTGTHEVDAVFDVIVIRAGKPTC